MSTVTTVHVDNRKAQIGMQVVAERVFFGGQEPASPEREALRGQISQRFAEAVDRGELGLDASMEIGAALERLLGPRGKWLETPGCRLASVEVGDDDREDLRLPLELLRPPTGAEPVLVRCALAKTESAPEGPRSYPEGGRIVLATADAGGSVPDEALRQAVQEVCRTGLHLASGSEHDRKRGAFEPALDHLPRVSRAALRQALGPRDGRPGAAVLELVCHVREQGLRLHEDDSGQEVIVGAEAFAAVLAPFVSHLRLVVLVPVAERPQGNPGRTLVDVALALHRRGLAAVVAPRVPLPAAASTGLTTALFGALLGDAEVAPASLELALVRANGYLSTKDRLVHLGLRLWARAADGHDWRPLVIRPYRGLLSFEPEHARFYLGRTAETTQVVERLAQLHAEGQPRLVLLVGASGVGKSSLAKAGVVPALAKQGWAAIVTRPALHSGEELEALVEAQAGKRRLVVVDQLEEVLTETDSHHDAGKYLQRLWGLASKEGVAVVATLRIDALDRGAEVRVDPEGRCTLEQLVPGPHAVFVHHLDEDALRKVIAEPARHVGLELDPGLVDRLCAEALTEPGALPMLELVLDELWSRREGRRMVAAEYDGGLAKRLADYADECVAALPKAQQEQAQRILVRVATGPVVELATWRRRTTVEALRPFREQRRAAFDAALAALVEARLVVRGDLRRLGVMEDDGSEHVTHAVESVELAHELLLRQWDSLRGWIEGATKQLAAIRDLERWVADHRKHETTLLTPEQLVYIEQAELPADGDDLNGAMVELIDVSRRAARKRKRLRRALILGIGVVALAFAGLSWWALGQRDTAIEQKHIAEEKTALAQERLDHAIALANELIFDSLPKLERHPEVRDISKEILTKLQQMLAKLGVTNADLDAQWNIAVAHDRRGNEAMHSDNVDVARKEYQAAHDIFAKLEQRFPWLPQAQRDLSVSLQKLGYVEAQAGNLAAARNHHLHSMRILEGLAKADPHDVQVQRALPVSLEKLGEVELKAGDLAAARDLFQRALESRERLAKTDSDNAHAQRALSISFEKLGEVELKAGDLAAARDLFQRFRDIAEGLAKADPHNAQAQHDFSVSLEKLGEVEQQAGDLAATRALYQHSLRIREGLAKADPHSAQAQHGFCASLDMLGNVELQAGNLAAARDLYQHSLLILEKLAKADPHNAQANEDFSVALDKLGIVEVRAGNLAVARDLYQRSLQTREGLAKADSHNAQAQRSFSVSLLHLGEVEEQAGNLAAARSLFQRGTDILDGLAKADPHNAQAQRDVSASLDRLGYVEEQAGNLAAARDLFRRSLRMSEELAKANRHSAQAQRALTVPLIFLGMVEVQAGNLVEARDLFQRALEVREGLADADPDNAMAQRDLFVTLNELGAVEVQAGYLEAARNHLQRSVEVAEGLAKADLHSAMAQRDLSVSLEKAGEMELHVGNVAVARDLLQRSLQIRVGLAEADPHSARAAFDVVSSLEDLAALAEQEGDLDALREVVTTANDHLDAMDAKGLITGYQKREAVREFFKRAAEELTAGQ